MVSDSTGNASIVGTGHDGIDIELRRLDDVPEVWASPVSLLKIDTEGYEPEVLEGARKLITSTNPSSTSRWAAITWSRPIRASDFSPMPAIAPITWRRWTGRRWGTEAITSSFLAARRTGFLGAELDCS